MTRLSRSSSRPARRPCSFAGRRPEQSAIASRLGLAPKTVRNQVSTILTKLAVDTRVKAAARARAAGL
jgi:DNA-binding transcriptional regulator YdaS (Cro superfamily)